MGWRLIWGLLVLLVIAFSGSELGAFETPKPMITQAAGGNCVNEPAIMRRYHMEYLKHQRDETMHEGGNRASRHGLRNCLSCHAVKEVPKEEHFCVSCHNYAAVSVDCFECHSMRPDGALKRQ